MKKRPAAFAEEEPAAFATKRSVLELTTDSERRFAQTQNNISRLENRIGFQAQLLARTNTMVAELVFQRDALRHHSAQRHHSAGAGTEPIPLTPAASSAPPVPVHARTHIQPVQVRDWTVEQLVQE